MFEHVGTYLKKVVGSWGKSISGPVFGVLALVGVVLQIVITDAPKLTIALKWASWGTLTIAALFVVIAQFRVWREDFLGRREAEEKLSAAADIRGPVWIQLSAMNPNADQTRPASALGYVFDCSNYGKVACELNKVIIKIVPPGGFGFNLIQDIGIPQVVEPGRAFKYEATCGVQGVSPEDLRRSKIIVCVVDSLGKEYQNTETKVTNLVLRVLPHANAQAVDFK